MAIHAPLSLRGFTLVITFALSDSGSGNGSGGVLAPFHLSLTPLPSVDHPPLTPQSRGSGEPGASGSSIDPPTLGGLRLLGEATDGDGDGKGSRGLGKPPFFDTRYDDLSRGASPVSTGAA